MRKESIKCMPESSPFNAKENINLNIKNGKFVDQSSVYDAYDKASKLGAPKYCENQKQILESDTCFELRKIELEKKLAALGVVIFVDPIKTTAEPHNVEKLKPEMTFEQEREKRIKLREIEKMKRNQGLVNTQYGQDDISEPYYYPIYENENKNLEKASELFLDQFPQKLSSNNSDMSLNQDSNYLSDKIKDNLRQQNYKNKGSYENKNKDELKRNFQKLEQIKANDKKEQYILESQNFQIINNSGIKNSPINYQNIAPHQTEFNKTSNNLDSDKNYDEKREKQLKYKKELDKQLEEKNKNKFETNAIKKKKIEIDESSDPISISKINTNNSEVSSLLNQNEPLINKKCGKYTKKKAEIELKDCANENDLTKKTNFQKELMDQIEFNKKKKEMEKEKLKKELELEEKRIQKENELLKQKYEQEKNKENAKNNNVQENTNMKPPTKIDKIQNDKQIINVKSDIIQQKGKIIDEDDERREQRAKLIDESFSEISLPKEDNIKLDNKKEQKENSNLFLKNDIQSQHHPNIFPQPSCNTINSIHNQDLEYKKAAPEMLGSNNIIADFLGDQVLKSQEIMANHKSHPISDLKQLYEKSIDGNSQLLKVPDSALLASIIPFEKEIQEIIPSNPEQKNEGKDPVHSNTIIKNIDSLIELVKNENEKLSAKKEETTKSNLLELSFENDKNDMNGNHDSNNNSQKEVANQNDIFKEINEIKENYQKQILNSQLTDEIQINFNQNEIECPQEDSSSDESFEEDSEQTNKLIVLNKESNYLETNEQIEVYKPIRKSNIPFIPKSNSKKSNKNTPSQSNNSIIESKKKAKKVLNIIKIENTIENVNKNICNNNKNNINIKNESNKIKDIVSPDKLLLDNMDKLVKELEGKKQKSDPNLSSLFGNPYARFQSHFQNGLSNVSESKLVEESINLHSERSDELCNYYKVSLNPILAQNMNPENKVNCSLKNSRQRSSRYINI